MRADRLLSILLLLQSRGQLTGRELAARLEVSERTLHRDMDALSAAGVPVFAIRGARGGWQLDGNWRTQVPGLDEAELRALLMAQPRVLGDRKLAAAAERALGKLMASLPVPLRARAESIRQRLYVDTTGWRGGDEDVSMLPIVQDAVARDRKLKIRYKGYRQDQRRSPEPGEPSGSSERVIDPLGLVAKGSTWYLVANTARGFRTFRVSRIENAILLDVASNRPANFDLEAYWRSSTEQFLKSWPRFYATLRMHPDAAREMQIWRLAGQIEERDSGGESWKTLRVEFDHEQQAVFVVLGLGGKVEVIAPTALRQRVQAELSVCSSLYLRSRDSQEFPEPKSVS